MPSLLRLLVLLQRGNGLKRDKSTTICLRTSRNKIWPPPQKCPQLIAAAVVVKYARGGKREPPSIIRFEEVQ